MADPREKKSCKVNTITSEMVFTNFDSILFIDAGATDGYNLTDDAGNVAFVPTGVPISIGRAGAPSAYIKVGPASGKSLNVSYILYQ